MIVVRNVFRVKFGQAKPAVAAFKEVRGMVEKLGLKAKSRLLTDLVGVSYTIVHELEFENLAAFEQEMKKVTGSPEWRSWYDTFVPYCESGSREIYNLVE
ncbi:MAG: NIPSNAP family protein [Acidobacteriota bacterium]